MSTVSPSSETDPRLAAFLSSIGDVYYTLDRDWKVAVFNAATQDYFGLPGADLHGRPIYDLVPEATNSPFTPMFRQAMDEGVSGRHVGPSAVRPERIVDMRVTPLGGDGIGVTVVDVTDNVIAEAAARQSRERLDLAVGAHAIGIYDWDLINDRLAVTAEWEEIYGFAPGEFTGQADDCRGRILPEDLARIDGDVETARETGQGVVKYEFRIRRPDGAVRWIEGAGHLVRDAAGAAVRIVGTNVDITERKQAELHQRLMVHELNHRVKNTLAIVQAIAWQSFRTGGMAKSARETFEGRIAALAAAHDVLTLRNWEAGSLDQMIAGAISSCDPGEGRVKLEGPRVNLEPKTAVALALAIHELATNAVKHGALSAPTGRVDVRWSTANGAVRLEWRESQGPPPACHIQRGFGVRLLERGLSEELQGCVRLDFRAAGLVCTIEAPFVADASSPDPAAA